LTGFAGRPPPSPPTRPQRDQAPARPGPVVIAALTLANKLGYHSAAWLHLTGARHVLWVDFIWLLANSGTFLLRFAILHCVLFADHPARLAAADRPAPRPAEVSSAPAA
jgi:hypothetical protein